MRAKLFMFLAACMCLAYGCKDDDNKAWNNDAPVYIWGKDRDGNKAVDQKVEKVHDMLVWATGLTTKDNANLYMTTYKGGTPSYSYSYQNIDDWCGVDTVNDRLVLRGDQIIHNGELYMGFLGERDWFIQKISGDMSDPTNGDTVGYIPNATLDFAEDTIKKLFAKEDYDQIYKIFESAFQFVTCTGAEFKALKEAGKN